jgi:hypothetical protein
MNLHEGRWLPLDATGFRYYAIYTLDNSGGDWLGSFEQPAGSETFTVFVGVDKIGTYETLKETKDAGFAAITERMQKGL